MEIGEEVRWLLQISPYYNEMILKQAEKDMKKENPLGLASSMSMGPGELDNHLPKEERPNRLYSMSILTKDNLKELDKPLDKKHWNELRLKELVNSQVLNMFQRGFTKEEILGMIDE